MLKLSQEDREDILDLLGGQGWPKTVIAIEQLVRAKGEAVLTLNEPERILEAKRRYDGARELLADIRRLREIISPKKHS